MELSQYTEGFAAIICLTLMVGMMLTFALGRRVGVRHHRMDPGGARSVSGAVEGAIFGLLGLLIAFTFDGAADRLEVRRSLIADEVNATETAWLRLELLRSDDRGTLRDDFRAYLDARLSFYAQLPNVAAAAPHLEKANQLQATIWSHAIEALPHATVENSSTLLLPALNQMFDVARTRKVALSSHPPPPIYGLMMGLALICSGLAGHFASPSARHPLVLPLLYASITSLAMFLILDLEYPRAGFIRIDSADVMLRELLQQMQSTTDLQVPHD